MTYTRQKECVYCGEKIHWKYKYCKKCYKLRDIRWTIEKSKYIIGWIWRRIKSIWEFTFTMLKANYRGIRKYNYYRYLQSEHWKNIKQKKLRIHPACQYPGCKKTTELRVHHTNYKCLNKEEIEWDLETLCEFHHKRGHGKGETFKYGR